MLVQEALDLIAVRPLNIMALVDEESKFPKVKYLFSSFRPSLNPIKAGGSKFMYGKGLRE